MNNKMKLKRVLEEKKREGQEKKEPDKIHTRKITLNQDGKQRPNLAKTPGNQGKEQ